ncbi:MAG: ATP-binding protein, partial [Oscillospiraceae bacterium]|nr:ATP-binding protein [Oscillospiraceae bacterium]
TTLNDQNFENILLGSLEFAEEILKLGYRWDSIIGGLSDTLHSFNPENLSKLRISNMGLKNLFMGESGEVKEEESSEGFSFANIMMTGAILEHARDIVIHGNSAIKELPKLSLGSFTTIDRKEIENYQGINNLIMEYVENDNIKPLSIAVFGTPGSGKSFGVSQIAQSISDRIKKLEFNVSQFVDESNLRSAFQMVRDEVLNGKIPLVFFDEFDSEKNGSPLGWLKNFLMPMQDGKFISSEGEHPIGKSIFVFAGGTSSTFVNFSNPKDDEKIDEFKRVKGPDFISRLRGTIDVLGPNQTSKTDYSFILRRALLLRSLCERKLKLCFEGDTFHIDDGILNAMLLIKEYKHGARSMESIIDMSRTNDLTEWNNTSLPTDSQISIHVDASKFMDIVLNDMNMQSTTIALSKAIYDYYYGTNKEDKIKIVELDYDFKKDKFLKIAKGLSLKLSSIKCSFDTDSFCLPTVESFTDDEIKIMGDTKIDDDGLLKEADIIPILKKIDARIYRIL